MATNPNMVAIQTVTVGAGGAANIEFTNIPQTYTDLIVKCSLREESTSTNTAYLRFNGNTGANYTRRDIQGSGSGVSSNTGTNETRSNAIVICSSGDTANTFGNAEIYVPNYTGNTNKSFSVDSVSENNATQAYTRLTAGIWNQTSAITSITILLDSGDFAQYSTATLYGVTSAGYGAKATGGIITETADYYIHTFFSSGTFTPTQNLSNVEYLVIAGGGGGGDINGGGGAGGYRCSVVGENSGGNSSAESRLSLTANTNYTVTVGAGGAGGGPGSNGSNSVFGSITSDGGGRGGQIGAGANGGSGGGGGYGANAGGTATANQGSNGGAGLAGWGGGGGGAGQVGATSSSLVGGAGGNGLASAITGTSTTRAGGGGSGSGSGGSADWSGSLGGTGGGGNGGIYAGVNQRASTAGTANTGGGGGGGGVQFQGQANSSASAGGSGIVIVRYAK